MYQLTEHETVIHLPTKTSIPFVGGNQHYQEYLSWLADGNTPLPYVPPVPPVPQEVTMAQARLALLQSGLLDQVNQAIPTLGQAAQIEWEYRTTVHRQNALVLAIMELFAWSEAQMDDLFTLANAL